VPTTRQGSPTRNRSPTRQGSPSRRAGSPSRVARDPHGVLTPYGSLAAMRDAMVERNRHSTLLIVKNETAYELAFEESQLVKGTWAREVITASGAIEGHHLSGSNALVGPGHTVVWAATGGKNIMGTQGILEYTLVIPPPRDPAACIPWSSVGCRPQEAATITISFSCSRETAGVEVGCSNGNVKVTKEVCMAMDRLIEATVIFSIEGDWPIPQSAPAPSDVSMCHSSRIQEEAKSIEEQRHQESDARIAEHNAMLAAGRASVLAWAPPPPPPSATNHCVHVSPTRQRPLPAEDPQVPSGTRDRRPSWTNLPYHGMSAARPTATVAPPPIGHVRASVPVGHHVPSSAEIYNSRHR